MKRHPALETLSFEHHDALVVALRLKKGLSRKAEIETMVEYALTVYENHLLHHFEQEEAMLLENLNHHPQTRAAAEQMLNEHQQFAKIVHALKNGQGQLKDYLNEFAQLLERHIRFEERNLFNLAEQHIPEEKLKAIGDYLHQQHRPINKNWKIEFWKDSLDVV